MPDHKRSRVNNDNLWQSLDKKEKDIVLYLMHTSSPVDIDTLGALGGTTAVKVLNVMEKLRQRKLVYEKKGYPKGVYFLNGVDVADFVRKHVPRASRDSKDTLKKIIQFYEQSLDKGDSKILALADLYRKLGDNGQGLSVIRKAADIYACSGKKDVALTYYEHTLQHLSNGSINNKNVTEFLESVLGKISITKHIMSFQEQISLLNKAQDIAKRYKKWDSLAKIKLAFAGVYQHVDQRKSYQFMKAFQRIAQKIGDQRMIKRAALLMVEYLHWYGNASISELIRKYESVIGDLEEFENDEAPLKATARIGTCYVLCGRVARGLGIIDTVRKKAATLRLQHVSIFCDLMTVLTLLEIRRIDEAIPFIDRISAHSDEVLGHYILRPFHAAKAYILCMKGDYEGAFENLKNVVEHSRKIGWMCHRGPWNFEYMDILEKKGFFHEEMNYDSEIEKAIHWNNVFLKGVAYRYRALRNIEREESIAKILQDLKKSEEYLKQSGGEIELARTHIALGDLYLKKGKTELGQSYLKKAWLVFSNIDKNLFPKDMLSLMPQEQRIEVMVERIISINESISAAHDMSSFLERAISLAMDFTMATRGAFINIDTAKPKIIASRNLDPLMLKHKQSSIINRIVSSIAEKGNEVIMPSSEKSLDIPNESLNKSGITTLICIPVCLGDETHGYLYLDNRLAGKPFPADSIPYLRLLCNQMAIGIANIRTFEEVKYLKDRFEDEAIFYKREMGVIGPIEAIIGRSKEITRVIDQIHQVAPTDSAVLILGETGVGKELVAKAIHNLSDRKDAPFIPVNLAALPSELVASELFGHKKGAFTGANDHHKGRFELAHNGTIFLDEIGDLPPDVPVKLLRVLQKGTFERLGSSKPIRSNFRVIAATHRDIRSEVEKGTFREDLYYRINVFPITVPPLRQRKDDIPLLTRHFLDIYGKKKGMTFSEIPADEMRKLEGYHWPGNVRELEHFIERSIILANGEKISFSGLENTVHDARSKGRTKIVTMEEMERKHINRALNETNGRVSGPRGAALVLGLKPTTLFYRMKKLGISKYRASSE